MNPTRDLLEVVLAGYLAKRCQGRAGARSLPRIAADLRGLGMEADARKVREAVADLVLAGAPIGTTPGTPAGAFVCRDRADFRLAYRNLYGRLRVQGKRCRTFRQTFERLTSGQRAFDFAEGMNLWHELEEAPLLGAAALADGRGEVAHCGGLAQR